MLLAKCGTVRRVHGWLCMFCSVGSRIFTHSARFGSVKHITGIRFAGEYTGDRTSLQQPYTISTQPPAPPPSGKVSGFG